MFPNYNIPIYPSYGMMGASAIPKTGLLGKIGGLKSINWQGLINNTSKTLGVINQAIPVVKEAGPMFNNMKSILKVASLFKDETDPVIKEKNNITQNKKNNNQNKTITNNNYSNSPNFFI